MALTDDVIKDMTVAMKNQDKETLSTLRMLKSNLQMEKIAKIHELSDDEAIAVVKRQIKQTKESILEYEKYGKTDEVEKLKKEIECLSKYLPEEISEEEINKVLDQIFAELNPTSMKDMGRTMKEAASRLGAGADMSLVSSLIKARLSK